MYFVMRFQMPASSGGGSRSDNVAPFVDLDSICSLH